MSKKTKTKDKAANGKADKATKALEAVKAAKPGKGAKSEALPIARRLVVGEGFQLADVDPSSTPGFTGDRDDAEEALAEGLADLSDLQERLWAESREGGTRSVLLVVQGMDTSGKGGVMRHVVGHVDPQGVRYTSFKAPTAEERAHDFLWRIRNALPGAGQIGVFDRSHYEDVLIARVLSLVPRATWSRRYATINRFEAQVAAKQTRIVKVMLHIGKDEQKARLAERLDRPDKYWKYNPGDLDQRAHWDEYMEAYQAALTKCSTEAAPWHVVPANHKWYARLAVQNLLLDTLRDMAPDWPAADFDVEAEKARLAQL